MQKSQGLKAAEYKCSLMNLSLDAPISTLVSADKLDLQNSSSSNISQLQGDFPMSDLP